MMTPTIWRLIFLALALAAAAAIAGAEGLLVTRELPRIGRSGTAAIGGPFTLRATNGQTVSDQTYRGKWVLIYFGYTYCPDACPTALNNISVALEKLGADADNLQPLFVTVDPQRDTREVMAEYLKSFDSRILGLTGSKDLIDSVIKEYHLFAPREKPETEGDDYLVSHSSYIYLMGPDGKFVNVIQGVESGDAIAAWLAAQRNGTRSR